MTMQEVKPSDLRVHGNQYGHRIIVQGGLLERVCLILGFPVEECNEPANHERIERWFNEVIDRACRQTLGDEA
jgi:hypothetical protein